MISRSIVWFKTDLRLTDNETLLRAIRSSEEIIPVYFLEPSQFKPDKEGKRKIGYWRAKFILESCTALKQQLQAMGSDLLFMEGRATDELQNLVRKYGVKKVFAKREVADEEKQEEKAVVEALLKLGCDFESVSTSTLYHAEDLPFAITHIPDLFTSFRKKIEKECSIRAAFERPEKIKSPILPITQITTLTNLGFDVIAPDSRAAIHFKGGEPEALKRLQAYFFDSKSIANYKETRNELIGSNYSSKFSAWLAQGCISPRFIHRQLLKYEEMYGANDSTYWLRFELLWRDFFRFMFKKHGNAYFQSKGITKQVAKKASENSVLLRQWQKGETGDAFVDANMRELLYTGFMSNRGRQNVASYLCHQLKLDWRLGATWFEEHLIDYDVCSNWGNWAYQAGVGNDARDRVFNTVKQAEQYDPHARYRQLWLTEPN